MEALASGSTEGAGRQLSGVERNSGQRGAARTLPYDVSHRTRPLLLPTSSTLIPTSSSDIIPEQIHSGSASPYSLRRAVDDSASQETSVNPTDSERSRGTLAEQIHPTRNLDYSNSEFWESRILEVWLSEHRKILRNPVWHTISPIPLNILERIQAMDMTLAMYAFYLVLQRPDRDRARDELLKFGNDLECEPLVCYHRRAQALLRLVKLSVVVNPSINHTISTIVYEHMGRDISVVVARLVLLLRDPNSYKNLLDYRETEAQALVDLLQELLDFDEFSAVKPLIFKALLRLCRTSGLHPRCLALSGLQKVGQQVTGGAFGDIWKGLVNEQSVCVKIMRIFENSGLKAVDKEFGREALIWRQLCHPNVLPFFGLYYLEGRPCLVSPMMENGNVMKFLTNKNPSDTDRVSLILDVALGLQYLHDQNVVHGDLKGLNILITHSGRACIADFGVSAIANAMSVRFTHSTVTVARGGTTRYQAPELLRGESENHFGSDVYAFACVCYEIMTGKVPFHNVYNDATVMFKILSGERPSPLPLLSGSPGTKALDNLWELMQNCWEETREIRPTASQVVERLANSPIGAEPTSSTTDWDDTSTSRFRRSVQAEPLLPCIMSSYLVTAIQSLPMV
ncbi:kinase-like domain-containing protein [Mycena sanguinolenta]|nr:kinase-like domain-containing protein [Mycena sanguinolenta]